MIKAVFKYDSRHQAKFVKVVLQNNATIERMYGEFDPKAVCTFDNIEHMNRTLSDLVENIYSGVSLIRYSEKFDFKKWWKGDK